jgi:hypothetical protein
MDLNFLQTLLSFLSAEELQALFDILKRDVLAQGIDLTLPQTATVQATIFMAQLLAMKQVQ